MIQRKRTSQAGAAAKDNASAALGKGKIRRSCNWGQILAGIALVAFIIAHRISWGTSVNAAAATAPVYTTGSDLKETAGKEDTGADSDLDLEPIPAGSEELLEGMRHASWWPEPKYQEEINYALVGNRTCVLCCSTWG